MYIYRERESERERREKERRERVGGGGAGQSERPSKCYELAYAESRCNVSGSAASSCKRSANGS
jgi:hypothetical protein